MTLDRPDRAAAPAAEAAQTLGVLLGLELGLGLRRLCAGGGGSGSRRRGVSLKCRDPHEMFKIIFCVGTEAEGQRPLRLSPALRHLPFTP